MRQADDSTVVRLAGHVVPRMLAHHCHVKLHAKEGAGLADHRPEGIRLEGRFWEQIGGYDTKRSGKGEHVPQVIENMVELVGIEPLRSVENM